MTLIAVYLGCLVLGGILIGASMFGAGKDVEAGDSGDADVGAGHGAELGGDHDASADADMGHDHGHDHHHVAGGQDASVGPVAATLLSLRFWTFALASFGMTGLLLTLIGAETVFGAGLSVLTGLAVGSGVTTLLRAVSRDTVSSALDARTLRGRDAEVVLSVGPGKLGKVRLVHNGQLIELPATTREERLLERAERVLVVDISGGTAEVTGALPDRRPPSPLATHS